MRTPSTELGQHPDISANTKALWVIDKGSGNVVYDVVSGRNCTDAGGPTWVSGLVGKGVDTGDTGLGFTDTTTAPGADSGFALGFWSCEAWVRRMGAVGGGVNTVVTYDNGAAESGLSMHVFGGGIGHVLYNKVQCAWIDALGVSKNLTRSLDSYRLRKIRCWRRQVRNQNPHQRRLRCNRLQHHDQRSSVPKRTVESRYW